MTLQPLTRLWLMYRLHTCRAGSQPQCLTPPALRLSHPVGGLALWSGETDPFLGPFNLRDAIISLACGGLAFLFWGGWGGSIVFAVRQRWIPPVALALLLLALLGLLLNWMVSVGYLNDRQSWAADVPF